MKMSSKARYGLYAAVELSGRYEKGYVAVSELASVTGVTEKYLEQILALMKKQNIVVALRGSGGGYRLSDKPENISVGAVLRAVEDNLEIVDCLHSGCSSGCNCVSRNLWSKLYAHINGYLDTVSLKMLSEDKL